MSFRGGKLYSQHSSSSLYGLACHVTLWLRLLSEHGKHHACLHSLSPLPSPPRPHIKSCWQKLVGRIRSSLRTRVECLRWCEDKSCNYLIVSLACLESLDLFQKGNLFYFTCTRLMFLRAFFFLVFWRHTPLSITFTFFSNNVNVFLSGGQWSKLPWDQIQCFCLRET